MITALRRFYRRNFCPIAKADFLELFDRKPNLCNAVILIEMSPLAGIRTTYLWLELRESSCLVIREFNFKTKTERTVTERALSKAEFTNVIRRIEEGGGTSLGNFSGKVKDGVHYSLCWGSPCQMFFLSIKNPQVGSKRHDEFVRMVKGLAS